MMFSVIIPAYNCQEELLRRCLDCFKNSKRGFEVIVIDDGSTNETPSILSEYAQINPCIRIVTQNNHGVSFSRNRGIEEAIGDYIVFCDADDMIDLDLLFTTVEYAEANAADYVLSSYHKIIDNEDNIINIKHIDSQNCLKQLLCEPNLYGTVWAKVFKRDFLIRNNVRFDSNLTHGEDSIFIIDCLIKAPVIGICDNAFYSYYVNLSSAAKSNAMAVDNYIKMMRSGRDRIGLFYEDLKPYYSCFCCINLLIIMVNYIFPKGCKYRNSKAKAIEVLKQDIIAEALNSYRKESISFKLNAVFFCLKRKWYFLFYIIVRLYNVKK